MDKKSGFGNEEKRSGKQLHFVPFYDKLETGVEKDERSFHERISHGMGFKDSGMKILKRGIMIGGAVTRSLIGIGAAATLIYAAFRKKKGHGDKKDSIG
jgi:hypothetical protein